MRIVNRKFHREYHDLEHYEAGILLLGAEVKSVRMDGIKIDDAFVRVMGNEMFLINADIPIYKFSRPQGYDSRRTRKLLLHKKEIIRLQTKLAGASGLTIIPIACYNKGPIIKLEIALAKGRGEIGKKKLVKARDVVLNQKREAKEYMKF